MTVVVDGYTRVMLTVIAILLCLVAVGMWCDSPRLSASAEAKIPDSGQQLDEVITQLEKVNDSIVAITEVMVSGDMKVQIVEPSANKKKTATKANIPTPK
jgi:hypothetical protein